MVGVAVKVTDVPAALGLVPAVMAMDTAGVTAAVNEAVMPLLVAVVGLAQARLLVMTQVTTWPAVRAEVLNVLLLVPAFTPLIFHW